MNFKYRHLRRQTELFSDDIYPNKKPAGKSTGLGGLYRIGEAAPLFSVWNIVKFNYAVVIIVIKICILSL